MSKLILELMIDYERDGLIKAGVEPLEAESQAREKVITNTLGELLSRVTAMEALTERITMLGERILTLERAERSRE